MKTSHYLTLKLTSVFLLPATVLAADSTIDPVKEHWSYAANGGWMLWYPSAADGAIIGQDVCAGWIYSGNFGWISLGEGNPGPTGHYPNDAAGAWGVNVNSEPDGVTAKLRGFAWSANVGWINFEGSGDPRVNLDTGKLTGFLWSANAGWITLENLGGNFGPRTLYLQEGKDSDGDGLMDAWEQEVSGGLSQLKAVSDPDGDGFSACQEFTMGTDPLNPNSAPGVLSISGFTSPLATIVFTSSPQRRYLLQSSINLDFWTDASPWFNPGPGLSTSYEFTPLPSSRVFYRIMARLPLPQP